MPQRELLRLADLALRGHLSPRLPHEVIRIVAEASRAERGLLLASEETLVAAWPDVAADSAGEATEEPALRIPLGHGSHIWTAVLEHAAAVDDAIVAGARLALHLFDLREELRQSRFDTRFRLWELEAVRAISAQIGGLLDPERIAGEVVAHVVGLLGVRSASLLSGPNSSEAVCLAAFGDPEGLQQLDEGAWSGGIHDEAVLAVPLVGKSGQIGLLVVGSKEARSGTEPFTDNDSRLLELFAVQTAVALENARLSRESIERARLEQELEVAAEIQTHLFPARFPSFPRFRVHGSSQPTREVGGDSFDVIHDDSRLLLVVADVSGKGVGAGMLAAGVHAAVRIMAGEGVPVERIAERLNSYLSGVTEDNRFATIALVEIAEDGALTAVHAGHCPSLVRRADGAVEELPVSGLPAGILPDVSYPPSHGRLAPGDFLVIYSDGLTEAEDDHEEELGIDRMKVALAGIGSVDAKEVCDALMGFVAEFTGGRSLQDDATVLVAEMTREPAEPA